MSLIDERQRQPPPEPVGKRRRAPVRTALRRHRPGVVRVLLNWGVLVLAVAVVLVVRDRAEAGARAALPAPAVRLGAADARTWRAFPAYRGIVPVLVYHGINTSGNAISTTPRVFAEQMLALKTAGFHAITLKQYVSFAHGDYQSLPSKPILLTFDDGRLDTYRAANDILLKYGFHATMFTSAAWPTSHPGFNLRWNELQAMQQSGTWTVQEKGGPGHQYVPDNAKGQKGSATSSILWGAQQFGTEIPGFRPTAFAVSEVNYGPKGTNDPRIPQLMLPWLRRHFTVVFGGDYLNGDIIRPYGLPTRFSPGFAYRITMGPRETLSALDCRLKDWAYGVPIWKEYDCLRPHLPHPYLRAPLP